MQSILEEDFLLQEEPVTETIQASLLSTSKWAYFIAIGCGFASFLIIGLTFYTYAYILSGLNRYSRLDTNFVVGISVISILIAGYLFLLIHFAAKFIKAIKTGSQHVFERAVAAFKLWLIITACLMSAYILLFIISYLK